MNLGEVEVLLHATCLSRRARDINARSSRRGKEQARLKIVEFGREAKVRRRDLMAGENPSNGTRETARSFSKSVSTSRCTTPQNVSSVSAGAAVISIG